MVRSLVKVFVRTRPTASSHGVSVLPDGESVSVNVPKEEGAGLINNQQETFNFKYDSVLDNVSQEATYTAAAHEVVESMLAGYNGTIFCYGQTGSGKTFTMSGDVRQYQHRGLVPRAIAHVFREVDMRVDKLYKVQVSYLEIYNDQLYDLLSETPGTSEHLSVTEDSNGNTFVRGLSTLAVGSEEEALSAFFTGEAGRSVAGHVLNAASSRSHTVFSVHLEMRTSEAASERAVLSKLHLVDLAGSERTKKTGVTGQALREAQFINRSLSFLEQTVNALSRRDAYVPFRQTKLTAVLRDALGGNCKTVMLANIWPEATHTEETLSTLRFAARVRTLVTDVSLNESSDPALLIKKYERQIKELKQELAMRDSLRGLGADSSGAVGEVESHGSGGFTVGAAPPDARPPSHAQDPRVKSPQRTGTAIGRQRIHAACNSPDRPRHDQGGPMPNTVNLSPGADRNAAFRSFKSSTTEGRQLGAVLKERAAAVTDLKQGITGLSASVNACKATIDSLTHSLASRASPVGGGEVPDSKAFQLRQELKAAKISYRADFEALKEARASLGPLLQCVAEARNSMVEEFNRADEGGIILGRDDGDADDLDTAEAFERMQMDATVSIDPDSGAYHAARRRTAAAGQRAPALFTGVKAQAAATRKKELEIRVALGMVQ
ncbi:MAG: hypothetical protein WDW38_005568 [Sanguina aurantia]